MKKILAFFSLIFLLGACSAGSSQEAVFIGKNYQMQNAWNNAQITLGFDASEPRFFGSVVNNYFGFYKLNGNKLSFEDAGVTLMMGPAEEMEAERLYLELLPKISTYRMDGTDLILLTADGAEYRFKEVPLAE